MLHSDHPQNDPHRGAGKFMNDRKPHLLQSALRLLQGHDATVDAANSTHVPIVLHPDSGESRADDRAEQAAQSATRLSCAIASLGYPFSLDEGYATLLQGQVDEIQFQFALAEQHKLVRSTLGLPHAIERAQIVANSPLVEDVK